MGSGTLPQKEKMNQTNPLLLAAEAAERAGNARSEQESMAAIMDIFRHKEAVEMVLMNRHINGIAGSHSDQERIPLRDDGDDFGRVEARIPKKLFFHLMKQRNFGWDGFTNDEGIRDLHKAFPQTRIKTISGRTTVAAGPLPTRGRRKVGVRFQPGTIEFAK